MSANRPIRPRGILPHSPPHPQTRRRIKRKPSQRTLLLAPNRTRDRAGAAHAAADKRPTRTSDGPAHGELPLTHWPRQDPFWTPEDRALGALATGDRSERTRWPLVIPDLSEHDPSPAFAPPLCNAGSDRLGPIRAWHNVSTGEGFASATASSSCPAWTTTSGVPVTKRTGAEEGVRIDSTVCR